MSRLRLDVNVSSTFPEKRLEVLLEMSDRAAGQLSPVDPPAPPGEKIKNSKKKKDSTSSLPPLKYSLIDDMKLQITR